MIIPFIPCIGGYLLLLLKQNQPQIKGMKGIKTRMKKALDDGDYRWQFRALSLQSAHMLEFALDFTEPRAR
jgi:hypothetical protein